MTSANVPASVGGSLIMPKGKKKVNMVSLVSQLDKILLSLTESKVGDYYLWWDEMDKQDKLGICKELGLSSLSAVNPLEKFPPKSAELVFEYYKKRVIS